MARKRATRGGKGRHAGRRWTVQHKQRGRRAAGRVSGMVASPAWLWPKGVKEA